jgi:hypothetical protein
MAVLVQCGQPGITEMPGRTPTARGVRPGSDSAQSHCDSSARFRNRLVFDLDQEAVAIQTRCVPPQVRRLLSPRSSPYVRRTPQTSGACAHILAFRQPWFCIRVATYHYI